MATNQKVENKLIEGKEARLLIEDIRKQTRDRHFSRANIWNDLANSTEASLRNIQFVISSALLTFTSTSPTFVTSSTTTILDRKVTYIFWAALILSMISGFVEHMVTRNYFVRGARRESSAEKIWSKTFPTIAEYEDLSKETDKLYKDFKDESPPVFLYIQFALNMAALILLVSKSIL